MTAATGTVAPACGPTYDDDLMNPDNDLMAGLQQCLMCSIMCDGTDERALAQVYENEIAQAIADDDSTRSDDEVRDNAVEDDSVVDDDSVMLVDNVVRAPFSDIPSDDDDHRYVDGQVLARKKQPQSPASVASAHEIESRQNSDVQDDATIRAPSSIRKAGEEKKDDDTQQLSMLSMDVPDDEAKADQRQSPTQRDVFHHEANSLLELPKRVATRDEADNDEEDKVVNVNEDGDQNALGFVAFDDDDGQESQVATAQPEVEKEEENDDDAATATATEQAPFPNPKSESQQEEQQGDDDDVFADVDIEDEDEAASKTLPINPTPTSTSADTEEVNKWDDERKYVETVVDDKKKKKKSRLKKMKSGFANLWKKARK